MFINAECVGIYLNNLENYKSFEIEVISEKEIRINYYITKTDFKEIIENDIYKIFLMSEKEPEEENYYTWFDIEIKNFELLNINYFILDIEKIDNFMNLISTDI